MIDWTSLLLNSLWILGLSLALGTLSYGSWQASVTQHNTWSILKGSGYLISFSLAALLFCVGLAGTSDTIWEIIIWSILAVLFLIQMLVLILQRRQKLPEKNTSDH